LEAAPEQQIHYGDRLPAAEGSVNMGGRARKIGYAKFPEREHCWHLDPEYPNISRNGSKAGVRQSFPAIYE
jgi:hypothetical protein